MSDDSNSCGGGLTTRSLVSDEFNIYFSALFINLGKTVANIGSYYTVTNSRQYNNDRVGEGAFVVIIGSAHEHGW